MAENKPKINPAQQPEQVDYRTEIAKMAAGYANIDANNHIGRESIDKSAWEYIVGLKIALLEKTGLWDHYCEIKLKKANGLEKRV